MPVQSHSNLENVPLVDPMELNQLTLFPASLRTYQHRRYKTDLTSMILRSSSRIHRMCVCVIIRDAHYRYSTYGILNVVYSVAIACLSFIVR